MSLAEWQVSKGQNRGLSIPAKKVIREKTNNRSSRKQGIFVPL